MNKPLLLVAAGMALVTAAVYGIAFMTGGSGLRSPEQLAKIALTGGDIREKEQAALDLERSGEAARVHLRSVLEKSQDPEIRVICIRGLQGLKDWYSMPTILAGLEDPNEQVRIVAYGAVSDLIGRTYVYKYDDSPDLRARSIKQIRKAYEVMNKNPPPHYRSTP